MAGREGEEALSIQKKARGRGKERGSESDVEEEGKEG